MTQFRSPAMLKPLSKVRKALVVGSLGLLTACAPMFPKEGTNSGTVWVGRETIAATAQAEATQQDALNTLQITENASLACAVFEGDNLIPDDLEPIAIADCVDVIVKNGGVAEGPSSTNPNATKEGTLGVLVGNRFVARRFVSNADGATISSKAAESIANIANQVSSGSPEK